MLHACSYTAYKHLKRTLMHTGLLREPHLVQYDRRKTCSCLWPRRCSGVREQASWIPSKASSLPATHSGSARSTSSSAHPPCTICWHGCYSVCAICCLVTFCPKSACGLCSFSGAPLGAVYPAAPSPMTTTIPHEHVRVRRNNSCTSNLCNQARTLRLCR